MNKLLKSVRKCFTAVAKAVIPGYKKRSSAKRSASSAAVLKQAFDEMAGAWSDFELHIARPTMCPTPMLPRDQIDLGSTLTWPSHYEDLSESPLEQNQVFQALSPLVPIIELKLTVILPCFGSSRAYDSTYHELQRDLMLMAKKVTRPVLPYPNLLASHELPVAVPYKRAVLPDYPIPKLIQKTEYDPAVNQLHPLIFLR